MIAGWDAAASAFLLSVWPIILGTNNSHAAPAGHSVGQSVKTYECMT